MPLSLLSCMIRPYMAKNMSEIKGPAYRYKSGEQVRRKATLQCSGEIFSCLHVLHDVPKCPRKHQHELRLQNLLQ